MITILGPTATGKTNLAANIAYITGHEIISADSRQVYKGMDIGSGKDISEYTINGKNINYHLIDIVDPGYEYNVFEFQQDFLNTYQKLKEKTTEAILCGGTGLYLDAILKGYKLYAVPENLAFRNLVAEKTDETLAAELTTARKLHNKTDITDRKRLIRALEIEYFYIEHPELERTFPHIPNITFGIAIERENIKKRITDRLKFRLQNGMVEEAEQLLKNLHPEQLKFYGLEYKFLTLYLTGEINYNDMFQKLNSAIHEFAKRQMTWFRKMEREGQNIIWINGELNLEKKIKIVIDHLKQYQALS